MKVRPAFLLLTSLLLTLPGCLAAGRPESPHHYRITPEGTVVWGEEYTFSPPGQGWQLLPLEDEDYAFAFIRPGTGPFPSQSTIAYSEEPFGYSRDLQQRQREFFRRFLWAGRIRFEAPQTRPITVLGSEGLEAVTEGREPVTGQKVLARVVFAHRGERVVAFYFTQWRPAGAEFDRSVLADFDRFVQSFQYLHPSFYQQL